MGLVYIRVSLTSWRGASLALVCHHSGDGVTIKWPYAVDNLLSVETGLGRWMLLFAVISFDAYLVLAFSNLPCHLENTGIDVFWLHWAEEQTWSKLGRSDQKTSLSAGKKTRYFVASWNLQNFLRSCQFS